MLRGDTAVARETASLGPLRSAALLSFLAQPLATISRSAVPADAVADEDLARLLLLRPECMDALSRPLRDLRSLRAFHRAWQQVMLNGSNAEDTGRLLAAWLTGIDGFPTPTIRDPDDWLALLDLLQWRGTALRQTGDAAQARRVLERAREVGRMAEASGLTGEVWRYGRWSAARVEVELAVLELGADRPEAALRALALALHLAPAPEVLADRLQHRVEFQGLHVLAGWASLMEWRRAPAP